MKEKVWNKKNLKKNAIYSHYPTTSILRSLFTDSYYKHSHKIKKNDKILDIGTLYTNNLMSFHERKCKLYATEVTNESVKIAQKILKKKNISCIVKKGTNQRLPFKSNFFNLVLSINVIHYEESDDDIGKSLLEYKRVLKPGGCLIVETIAKKHFMNKKLKKTKKNIFILKLKSDFRNNQKFYFFSSKKNIREKFKIFKKVEIAEILELYPKKKLHFFDIKCFK
jgi:ubiquinone/menaquinone biosynthesis C-methylase UbiE